MKPFTFRQLLLTLAVGAIAWSIVAALSMMIGSTGDFGWPGSREIARLRSEPVLLASLIGAALGASGCAYQAVLRNPLADPYLLGVSSGASLFSYLWQFGAFTFVASNAGLAISQQAFSFVGAMVAVAIVFSLSTRRGRLEPISLLLVGVIVSTVCGSIYLLISELHKGLAGSGSGMRFLVGGLPVTLSAEHKWLVGVVTPVCWIALLSIAGKLNVASLSDEEATSLGVNIQVLRWSALLIASLMTAAAVAISGPIGFVGLIAPHMARLIVGVDQRKLLPLATAFGAALLVLADAGSRYLARTSIAGQMLPVGVLTGLLGGPFFLVLLWQHRRRT